MFFKKTLESLANQTDKRFNVYIGDDASPEDPEDLINEYKHRFKITYKRFKDNLGKISLTKQWDRCIALSEGEEWIMILGDDDYYSANVIASFYKNETNIVGKVNVVRFAKQNIFNDQERIAAVQYNPLLESATDSYYRRITGATTSTLSEYAFTRTVYEKYGFHPYPLAWQSDNRAWIEFAEDTPIYSINEAVVSVICSSQSITGSQLYANQKRKANLAYYKYLITEKLHLFNTKQAIRVLHKFENEIKYREHITYKEYLFLLPYYVKNYEQQAFKGFLKKITKSIFNRA